MHENHDERRDPYRHEKVQQRDARLQQRLRLRVGTLDHPDQLFPRDQLQSTQHRRSLRRVQIGDDRRRPAKISGEKCIFKIGEKNSFSKIASQDKSLKPI